LPNKKGNKKCIVVSIFFEGTIKERGHIVFAAVVTRLQEAVEWCTSTVLMTASLSGMVQWGIDDGRSVMDSRRVEV
jgi:hypothetical protein